MTNYWIHGNAVTVENPENLSRLVHFGWGLDVSVMPGKTCWFHVPLPTMPGTPVLEKFYLLYLAEHGIVRNLHFWDGATRFFEINGLNLTGDHLSALDQQNTFLLPDTHTTPRPNYHRVAFGVGVSFQFVADNMAGAHLVVAGAGGTYAP